MEVKWGKKKKNRGQLDFVLMDICRLTRQVQMSDAKITKKIPLFWDSIIIKLKDRNSV